MQAYVEAKQERLVQRTRAKEDCRISENVIKATLRTGLQSLTSPVDGVVQQLAVHAVGRVATPAQSLLAVVPANTGLEIEAMVRNRDNGFDHFGQEAVIN
jgi:hemolysin D